MSRRAGSRRAAGLWAALVVATLVSWRLGEGAGAGRAAVTASTAVLVVALLKVSAVLSDFMELRHAPTPWRLGALAWVLVTGGAMITLFVTT